MQLRTSLSRSMSALNAIGEHTFCFVDHRMSNRSASGMQRAYYSTQTEIPSVTWQLKTVSPRVAALIHRLVPMPIGTHTDHTQTDSVRGVVLCAIS